MQWIWCTTFNIDGVHDDQPTIMAAIAAYDAGGALITEVGQGHVFIPAGFHVYLVTTAIIEKAIKCFVLLLCR